MKEYLEQKLKQGTISTRVLLARARLAEVRDWESPVMNDPRYIPFYYYLGTQIQPNKVLEIGFGLGLTAAAFLQSCNTVEKYVGYQITNNDFYYSLRLGTATLKEYYKNTHKLDAGNKSDLLTLIESDKWDTVLITQKVDEQNLREYLDKIWANSSSEALIVVDHIHDEKRLQIFQNWCESINRQPEIFETRYTLGITRK